MPKTPNGTRIWPTLMPLGRRRRWVISPTGSGMAAICSQPSATVANAASLSFRRSINGSSSPALRAATRSAAFAICKASAFSRRRRAKASNAASLEAVDAAAMAALAARAAAPIWLSVAARSALCMRHCPKNNGGVLSNQRQGRQPQWGCCHKPERRKHRRGGRLRFQCLVALREHEGVIADRQCGGHHYHCKRKSA